MSEERERNVGQARTSQQADYRAAENDSVVKSPKLSESRTPSDLNKNTEEAVTAPISGNPASVTDSSTCPLQTGSVVIFDPNGQPLQCERMVIGQSENGQLYVIPSNHLAGTRVILSNVQVLNTTDSTGICIDKPSQEAQSTLTAIGSSANTVMTVATPSLTATKTQTISAPDVFAAVLKPLPTGAPHWAKRLRSCEKIGDSYRGYCNTEVELEAVLLLHKQQTHSVFGTRQSPSPAKPATRLMWKSQYVPYDGIPFVNAGSRAIVMECQFGPRRKGAQPKKSTAQDSNRNVTYKATCPARIYIKKVRKFPDYKVPVDSKVDKKIVRQEQEKAFFNLKKKLWNTGGVIRYYIQLPTQKAHMYHDMDMAILCPLPEQPGCLEEGNDEEEEEDLQKEVDEDGEVEDIDSVPSRLHPLVAEKIRALVEQGCNQVYSIRKQLRRFVEREMFTSGAVPERHNLCYFPTVNDIKNHMHEVQKNMQLTDRAVASAGTELRNLPTETLTVMPAAGNVKSQKEVLLEENDTLCPEAVQLFSSVTTIQPKIFAHLQGVQLQPETCPAEGALAQHSVSAAEPSDPSNHSHPQNLFLNPSCFLHSSCSVGEPVALPGPPALLSMGQLVDVSDMQGTVGAVTQILLENGQTVPVHIMNPSSTAASASVDGNNDSEMKPVEQSGDTG